MYSWNDGQNSHRFKQEKVEDGNGCMFVMDSHDKHILHTFGKETVNLSIFNPALIGTETHNLCDDISSCY